MSHFEMFEVRCRLCNSSCIENIISLLTMIKHFEVMERSIFGGGGGGGGGGDERWRTVNEVM